MTRVLRLGNAGTAVPKERCDNAYHLHYGAALTEIPPVLDKENAVSATSA